MSPLMELYIGALALTVALLSLPVLWVLAWVWPHGREK